MIYHLTELGRGIRLTKPRSANIFLGHVKYWDDNAIASQNPTLHLPHTPIAVVHRSDGSGTTYIFTDALGPFLVDLGERTRHVDDGQLAHRCGSLGKLRVSRPSSPRRTARSATSSSHTPSRTSITFARVQNTAGNFISPGPNSIASAASDFPQVSATHFSIVNASGDAELPDLWIQLAAHLQGADRSRTRVGARAGGELAHPRRSGAGKPLLYVPLPASIQALALTTLKKMVDSHGHPFL